MIDLRGRSISQFLDEADLYKDLCKELQNENKDLQKQNFMLNEEFEYLRGKNESDRN